MPEPIQLQTRFPKPFRRFGYGLLFLGFLWLCFSASYLPMGVAVATSRFKSDGFPRKENYEFVEAMDALSGLSRHIEEELPWVFPPALLMLVGALILARTPVPNS